MKTIKKICKTLIKIILTLVLGITLIAVIGLNYKTVLASHKIKEIVDTAKDFQEIDISDNVKIVGLGEATHGNVEFQELKLEMFKKLVEEKGFTAFALEADFADCLNANNYIQGGEGDSRELVNNMIFDIYHTDEMAAILDWMREYNLTVPEDKKLRFYGFDMQNPDKGVAFLEDYMSRNGITGIDVSKTEYFVDENRSESLTKEDVQKIKNELSDMKKAIEYSCTDTENVDFVFAIKTVENIETALGYGFAENMYGYRDQAMADNATWILELEKKLGNGKVMLAAHDGHISKVSQSAGMPVTMGEILKNKYGDEYYSLGTDFFKGKVNISVLGMTDKHQRKDYYVTTADPIAYQAKYTDEKRFYVDFESLSKDNAPKLYDMINSDLSMGSIGEGFTGAYYFIHSAYRIDMVPADLYDGMIFYYNVTPIS